MVRQATEAEMQAKNQWAQDFLAHRLNGLPFSFLYGGQFSGEMLGAWTEKHDTVTLDSDRTRHTFSWTDPQTCLEVRCVAIDYARYPAIEWTVTFKNLGDASTPLLEQVHALDIQVHHRPDGDFILHHNRGDTCAPDAYEPGQQVIARSSDYQFAPTGGRPTSLAFPYFNLQDGQQGIIMALGWPGQWSARFASDAQGSLHITGGQEVTRFRLLPGEEARTPLAVLMFWQGDIFGAQNLWRQWMFAHNLPRRHNQLPPAVSAMCRGLHQNEDGEKNYIDLLHQHQIGIDYWWMDAGWYPGMPGPMGEWTQVGAWEPDPARFPRGIRAVADYAHERNMKLILWFELERVSPGSAWSTHDDWLLALKPEDRRFRMGGVIGTPQFTQEEAERNQIREGDRLFNLGHPEARHFLVEYVSSCISQWGIDLFRLDFNISPLLFWRAADEPERQGVTENKYVAGLLSFFDELLRRHPDLLIDSCASGGRRIDLETLRRAVVYTRSDYWCLSPAADQCQTQGIASWVPHYLCSGCYDDTYRYHSNLAPAMGFDNDISQDRTDWDLFRQRVDEWRGLASYFSGDYYPLSPWSSRDDAWLAWQFYRPDQGDGILQFFRRAENEQPITTFRLHGLDPAAPYNLRDLETGAVRIVTGKELTESGLTVEINNKPGSVVIIMNRADGSPDE